jgi:hypothetical protein
VDLVVPIVRVMVIKMKTVQELVQAKEELAMAIYDLLDNFSRIYGVLPTIIVETTDTLDGIEKKKRLWNVKTEVKL